MSIDNIESMKTLRLVGLFGSIPPLNYYKILGVSARASKDQIKLAYKGKAK